jgi:two-component system, NarL family, nitrate/nitrite response regulator NarL
MLFPLAGHDPVQVFVIAPPMVCWGLEHLVQSAYPRMAVAGTAASVAESLPALERHATDVVLLELDGDDKGKSVRALQEASWAKLVVLTGSREQATVDRIVMAGVRGVVHKSEAPSLLLDVIHKVHNGHLCVDRAALTHPISAERLSEKSNIATLTLRELQTVAAITSDASASTRVLAVRLCISQHTLRNHLTSIYSKLGVANRVDLYALASRHSSELTGLASGVSPKVPSRYRFPAGEFR